MIQQDSRGNAKKVRTRQQLLKPECCGSRTNEQRLVLKRLSVAGFEVIGDKHGFLYSDGSYTTIDVPDSGANAYGINDAGQIVGWFADAQGGHGFLATTTPEPSTLLLPTLARPAA